MTLTLCLTRDHLDVIARLAVGHSHDRIGRALGIAAVTVRARIRAAARSVGITDGDLAPQLVDYAVLHGYVGARRRAPALPPQPLHPERQAVLDALARGLSARATATELGIPLRTVNTHRGRLYELLQVHTAAHAVARARLHGYLNDPPHTPEFP
ncbi:helix-turn-helix transcriptional regulator [Streptomyces sp. NPDC052114]|uniref:helix-turn-helix transcriptional regulator n=1 Tax=unclassified Streptomyces TaxID=2593676 RepID=UPI00343EA48D